MAKSVSDNCSVVSMGNQPIIPGILVNSVRV